jgi:hypothetical protein
VAWGKVVAMDVDFLWKNPRKIKFDRMDLQIPSVEADLITMMAHVVFESLHFSLGDLLYMFELSKQTNLKKIINQAEINNWSKTLENIVSIMNGLHRAMYYEPSPMENAIHRIRNVKPEFPFYCPLTLIIRAHIEKRAWEKIFSIRHYVKNRVRAMRKVNTFKGCPDEKSNS